MNDVYKYLEKYNQTNLLNFYNEISNLEKEKLINAINNIDFKLMKKLYVNSYIDEELKLNKVSPLKIINKVSIEDRENYQIISIQPDGRDAELMYTVNGINKILKARPHINMSFEGEKLFSITEEKCHLFTEIPQLLVNVDESLVV